MANFKYRHNGGFFIVYLVSQLYSLNIIEDHKNQRY